MTVSTESTVARRAESTATAPGPMRQARRASAATASESPTRRRRGERVHRTLLGLVYVILGVTVVLAAYHGFEYYRLPLEQRARHPLYWQLKPGGTAGLRFGQIGAAMMTLMLLYSVRKRVPLFRRLGPLNRWLDWHIVLGVFGPLFIVLHTSLKIGGVISIAFWSMAAVAGSGVFGRYLYQQIPRTQAGDELTLLEVQSRDEKLSRRLVERWGLDPRQIAEVTGLAERAAGRGSSLLGLVFKLPLSALTLGWRLRAAVRSWPGVERSVRLEVYRSVLEKARLHHRLLVWDRLRHLFHYWHVLHKPFALIMYSLLVLHVAVAWMTGYAGLPR